MAPSRVRFAGSKSASAETQNLALVTPFPIFLKRHVRSFETNDVTRGPHSTGKVSSPFGRDYHINRSNLLVLESKADMQKRGQASHDDGDALALTFAREVAPVKVEERDEEEEFGGYGINGQGAWMR
jgi:hypothetical protein